MRTIGKLLNQQQLFKWSDIYQWQGIGDEDERGRDPEVYQNSSEYLEKFMAEFTTKARAEKEALVPYEKAKGYRF